MMHWGSYGWGVGLGWVYMILFWAVIITAVVYLVKFVENELDGEVRSDTPIDMIKSRYAKGEITKVEFEQLKDEPKKS